MHFLLISLFFLVWTSQLFGQRKTGIQKPGDGAIYGSIQSQGGALPFASVSLFNSLDSSLVNGVISDEKGKFQFEELNKGMYFLKISFVGYEVKDIANLKIGLNSNLLKIPEIELISTSENLEAVEISSNLPAMEYKIDRKVVNVDKQITATSGTAVDVLQNVPSVQVGITGDVRLRGSSGFMVFIDGRPSILTGSDALNQIPASTIDKIELITNPSAKFDPDGTSGIINIITKKNKMDGFSGVLNGNVGWDDKYGGDALFYYRKSKLNYFVGADYNHRYFPGVERINRQTTSNDTTFQTIAEGEEASSRTNYTLRGGVEMDLGIKDYLTLNGSVGFRQHENLTILDYVESTSLQTLTNNYISKNRHSRSGGNYSASADYEHKFLKADHKINAQIIYNYRATNERNDNDLFSFNGGQTNGQRSTENGPGTEGRMKLDYQLPFGPKSKLEIGTQARFQVANDTNKVYNLNDTTGEYVFQPIFSNSIQYRRDIYALYGIYAGEADKIGYQFGVRTEYVNRLINKLDGDSSVAFDRWDFFPSVHFSYQLPKNHQLMVSYSRRIERPRGWYFEPFITWVDAYNVRSGNPDLLAEYIDSYELGYSKRIKKSLFSLESYYRMVTNKIEWIRSVYAENIILRKPANVGRSHSLGVEGMVSTDVYKWWNMDLMGNLYYFKGDYNTANLNNTSTNWNTRFNNTFYLSPRIQFQLNSMYQSQEVTAQGRTSDYYTINAAYKHTFFDNKLSLTLQANDLLQSTRREFISEGDGFRTQEFSRRYSPIVMLNVSYRINNYKARKNQGREETDGGADF
ncbi:MAG: TonB-dependent receptor [Vicingaceae bacterium]